MVLQTRPRDGCGERRRGGGDREHEVTEIVHSLRLIVPHVHVHSLRLIVPQVQIRDNKRLTTLHVDLS